MLSWEGRRRCLERQEECPGKAEDVFERQKMVRQEGVTQGTPLVGRRQVGVEQ